MKRATTLLALALTACGTDVEPPTTERTQPLLGAAKYDKGCNTAERSFLNRARFFGRVTAASDAFVQCVDETMRNGSGGDGPYLVCDGDPHQAEAIGTQVDRVLAVARSTNDLAIACCGGGGLASAAIGTYAHTSDEAFSFSGWLGGVVSNLGKKICTPAEQMAGAASCRWAAYPWPYNQAAGLVWHEVMHTHGYGHGDNDDNTKAAKACGHEGDASFHYQNDTIPYIVGNCVSRVIVRSHAVCAGGLEPSRCADGALQLTKTMGGNDCECVHDPSADHTIALLTGEGSDAIDAPLTIEANEYNTTTWRPADPVAFGGGDFNGDGRPDVLLRESNGSGALVMAGHDGDGGVVRIAQNPVGVRMGGWMLGGADVVSGIGNFDGWLDDEVVIRSGWGLGLVGHYDGAWHSYALHAYGSNIGSGWTLASTDEVSAIGDFDGDGTDELLLKAAGGALGVVDLVGGALTVTHHETAGSWLGSWHMGAGDQILGVADFDADGADEYLVRSGWGLGVVGLGAVCLESQTTWANNTSRGGWLLWASDDVAAVGDFDGDGRGELLLRDAARTAMLEPNAQGGFGPTASVAHGDRIDNEWLLNASDVVAGVADLYGSGRDALVLRSGWGTGVIEHDGGGLIVRFLTANDTMAGAWLLRASDDTHGRSATHQAGRHALVLSR